MHKSFKNLGLASAAMALVMAPTVASAQEQGTPPSMPDTGTATTPPPTTSTDTTTESLPDPVEGTTTAPDPATPDTGLDPATPDAASPDAAPPAKTITPEEQEAAIATWPAETQTYYLSLDDERKQMFWALTDTDKVRLSQLPEEQRELAWGQIKAQIKGSQG